MDDEVIDLMAALEDSLTKARQDTCYWQFHEASGDGNDVCPNCGSDFKRG